MQSKLIFLLSSTLLLNVAVAKQPVKQTERGIELDRIVAVVNHHLITQLDLNDKINHYEKQLKSQNIKLPKSAALRQKVLDMLIDHYLQLDLAKDQNIEANDSEVAMAVNNIAKQNNISVAELDKKIQESGIKLEQFKKDLQEKMIIEKFQQRQFEGKINFSPAEIKAMVKNIKNNQGSDTEYHLQHIFLPLSEDANGNEMDTQMTLIRSIQSRYKAGEDFKNLATQYSKDEDALRGGDWGWQRSTQLPERFAEAVKSLQPGALSQPIRTGNGLHLLRLVDLRNSVTQLYSNNLHVKQILLRRTAYNNDAELKRRAQFIIAELNKGLPFDSLAKTYSEEPNSATKGGDLGWIIERQLPGPMQQALQKIPVGKWSQEPLLTSYGCQIFQVLASKKVNVADAELEEMAKRILFEKKMNENLTVWLKDLRKQAFIKINV